MNFLFYENPHRPHHLAAPGPGRPVDCSAGAPTDPDVQNYRIRFLKTWTFLCYAISTQLLRFEDAVDNLGRRQRVAFQKKTELLPSHAVLSVSAIEPLFPPPFDQVTESSDGAEVSRDPVVGIMASHFRFKSFPLLPNRLVHVLSTPLADALDAPCQS